MDGCGLTPRSRGAACDARTRHFQGHELTAHFPFARLSTLFSRTCSWVGERRRPWKTDCCGGGRLRRSRDWRARPSIGRWTVGPSRGPSALAPAPSGGGRAISPRGWRHDRRPATSETDAIGPRSFHHDRNPRAQATVPARLPVRPPRSRPTAASACGVARRGPTGRRPVPSHCPGRGPTPPPRPPRACPSAPASSP